MAFGKKTKEEIETPKEAADDLMQSTPEEVACVGLINAKSALSQVGHFETNEAIECIDKALEWLAKAEATDEP